MGSRMSSKKTSAGDCTNMSRTDISITQSSVCNCMTQKINSSDSSVKKSSVSSCNTLKINEAACQCGDKKDMPVLSPPALESVQNVERHESWKDVVERFSHDFNHELHKEKATEKTSISSQTTYPVVFRWTKGGQNVLISGSYDGWSTKSPLVRSDSEQYTIVQAPIGRVEYKFNVDGVWVCDTNEVQVKNDVGTTNNVIDITPADYNVLAALSADDCFSDVLPGFNKWGQIVPQYKSGFTRDRPPMLPPYLLNSILNTETPLHIGLDLLPEPNRVALNHVYTTAIKEGVIVLSTTWRYRRKYITTILYKPL